VQNILSTNRQVKNVYI